MDSSRIYYWQVFRRVGIELRMRDNVRAREVAGLRLLRGNPSTLLEGRGTMSLSVLGAI